LKALSVQKVLSEVVGTDLYLSHNIYNVDERAFSLLSRSRRTRPIASLRFLSSKSKSSFVAGAHIIVMRAPVLPFLIYSGPSSVEERFGVMGEELKQR